MTEQSFYKKTRVHIVSLLVLVGSLFVLSLNSTRAQTQDYNEAPQLAERVAAGELPPVEERLPAEPLVLEPYERIGDYGGTWRHWLFGGPAGGVELYRSHAWEHLVIWNLEWTDVVPNVAKAFEANEEATEFTFYLREGMKWSDGHPFTADDIMFWYEDIFMNDELTPVRSGFMVSGGEPVVVEKIDDYTVVFRFAAPNGLFLAHLASQGGGVLTQFPRHYLEQFHSKYNPEGIDALVSEAGAADWVNLFDLRAGRGSFPLIFANAERPVLHAWTLNNAFGEGTQVVVERNPYYWKVDTAGNQLPYIDRIIYEIFQDQEVMLLKALNGELDIIWRYINLPDNKALLLDYAQRGDYQLFDIQRPAANVMGIYFNLTHNDPVKREIFNNKDFRIGLSHAIDRQEIIDLFYFGLIEPQQLAPPPGSPVYNERLAKQYIEYDVALANEYLDSAGYAERDPQGFRLGPDGQRISFIVEVPGTVEPRRLDAMELIGNQWREIGIDVQVRNQEQSLFQARQDANEHDAVVWGGDHATLFSLLLRPAVFAPINTGSRHAVAWGTWYTGGTNPNPQEPPLEVQRQLALYDELKSTVDVGRQAELLEQMLEIAADQFYHIGIGVNTDDVYGIIKNNFHNVPGGLFEALEYGMVIPGNPSTFFISE